MAMKPILSNTPMVQALLNTKPGAWPAEPINPSRPCKRQTRRAMKPQPEHRAEPDSDWHPGRKYPLAFWVDNKRWIKPKYQVGDILYVRETWRKHEFGFDYRVLENGQLFPSFDDDPIKWKPSIHMPREAARLFLEVREMRVERLQDICHKDVIAEGVKNPCNSCNGCYEGYSCIEAFPVDAFKEIWSTLNSKDAWESNPWVWVCGFMRAGKDAGGRDGCD